MQNIVHNIPTPKLSKSTEYPTPIYKNTELTVKN